MALVTKVVPFLGTLSITVSFSQVSQRMIFRKLIESEVVEVMRSNIASESFGK